MIETERLLLRPPRQEDAPDLLEAFADPEVVRYIGDGTPARIEDVEESIAVWIERWELWGLGHCSLERKADGHVLGRAGFLRWDPQTWEIGGTETELGWVLAREHWGKGYATEAASALRDWAFAEQQLERLISLIRHDNLQSVRVAERIGERYERDVEVRGKPSWLYSIER